MQFSLTSMSSAAGSGFKSTLPWICSCLRADMNTSPLTSGDHCVKARCYVRENHQHCELPPLTGLDLNGDPGSNLWLQEGWKLCVKQLRWNKQHHLLCRNNINTFVLKWVKRIQRKEASQRIRIVLSPRARVQLHLLYMRAVRISHNQNKEQKHYHWLSLKCTTKLLMLLMHIVELSGWVWLRVRAPRWHMLTLDA